MSYRQVDAGYGRVLAPGGYRPGPSASAAFVPTDIAGLSLWLDASDASTISDTGGAVSEWRDKSGNTNHATQATPANQPTTGTRTQNGLNVIDFDGGDRIVSAGLTLTQPNTYFVVYKADTTPDNSGYLFDGVSARQLVSNGSVAGKMQMFAGSIVSVGTRLTTPQIVYARFSGATSQFAQNGAAATTTSPGTNGVTGLTVGDRYQVGTGYLDGFMAEILVYAASLSAEDRSAVEAYLAAKWGVTLS